jgi:hypothetical protein
VRRDVQIGGEHLRKLARGHDERSDAERLGIDAERDVSHRRVPSDGDLGDVGCLGSGLAAHFTGELGECLLREPAEGAKRARIEHRGAYPGNDIGAERLLLVEHRRDGERRSGSEIKQCGDDGRGAEVKRYAQQAIRGVAGLDVDEYVVDYHGGHLEVRAAQPLTEAAQYAEVDAQLQVIDLGEDALEIGALVREGRLGEFEIALLRGGPQYDLTANADRGCFRTRY